MSFATNRDPVVSRAHKIYWDGWETTTVRLQSQGWDLTADQSRIWEGRILLGMRSPCGYLKMIAEGTELRHPDNCSLKYEFAVRQISTADQPKRYTTMEMTTLTSVFEPIDCYPQTIETKSIDDLLVFAPIKKPQELIIDPPSVQQLLDQIRNMQSSTQADIRKRNKPVGEKIFHAQILSFAA